MNCPFYGRAMFMPGVVGQVRPFLLLDTAGNQCAMVVTAHAACHMEIHGDEPDWQTCPLVREARMEPVE